jgi:hypothetical protein
MTAPVPSAAPAPDPRPRLSEDWLATLTGLAILLLVMLGVITKAIVP